MKQKKVSIVLIIIGIVFLFWAIFGRYIVLPGYFASLASGTSQNGTMSEGVPAWKIARYLLWAFAFKLGIYFIFIGAALRTNLSRRRYALLVIGGLFYISIAYAPLPGPAWLFGIGGVLMTSFIVLIVLRGFRQRDSITQVAVSNIDSRLIGYFFFAMATYTLCGLLGVRASALNPELMIEYNLQADAISFGMHALTELVLGWLFILLSYRTLKSK